MKDRGGEGEKATTARIAPPVQAVGWKAPAGILNGSGRVEDVKTRAWNTRNLPARVGTDLIAAASAGFLVAPIITIIDR